MQYATRAVDLSKDYVLKSETVRALRSVTFDVEVGDYLSIMGPSGSGKSTLLNLLGCLDRPTDGQLFLGDEDVARAAGMSSQISQCLVSCCTRAPGVGLEGRVTGTSPAATGSPAPASRALCNE